MLMYATVLAVIVNTALHGSLQQVNWFSQNIRRLREAAKKLLRGGGGGFKSLTPKKKYFFYFVPKSKTKHFYFKVYFEGEGISLVFEIQNDV